MEDRNESSGTGVVYWALNNYGVTVFDLLINVFIVLLSVWIILLNVLVLDTLIRMKPSREPTDIFICSLAIADTVSGISLLYNTSYNLTNYQVFMECVFRLGVIQALGVSSVLHMTTVTLDRYLKIVQPYRYNTVCNKASVLAASITIWVISVIIGLLPLMGWTKKGGPLKPDEPVCGFFAVFEHAYLKLIVALFWLPFALMSLMYAHIFCIAHKHAKIIAAQEVTAGVKGRERHSWKYTKTICLIVGIYFASWVPSGIVIMLDFAGNLIHYSTVEKGTLLLYVSSIAFFNSLINPIIYAFKITAVRLRFRAVFCRKPVKASDLEASQSVAGTVKEPREKRVVANVTTCITEVSE